ncbi:MAG: right-handed parallel beta-helix repeat-containing protein [Phycisphaerales bacterium]
MNEIERRTLIGAAGIGAIAALSKAGPINPPAGPVGSTGRTLDEVYNRIPAVGAGDGRAAIAGNTNYGVVLNAPGSYLLTGDVVDPLGNGIVIGASDITLDLNGFAVRSGSGSASGIALSPGLKRVVVRNGRVNGFQNGILINAACQNVVLEDLLVTAARVTGIYLNSALGVRVRRCTVQDTGATTVASDSISDITGIVLNSGASTVEDCTVNRLYYYGTGSATRRGIWAPDSPGNVIARCTIAHDGAITATGIAIAGTNVYRDNTVVHFSTQYSGGFNGGGNT